MKGHNPSTAVLFLMSWTIFITTIHSKEADFSKILLMYSLRWNIESIFKTWKSYMNFDRVHNVSEKQLRILLTARLIMIVLCTHHLFNYCSLQIRKLYNKELSMMKFINYLMKNIERIISLLANFDKIITPKCTVLNSIAKYCSYDRRKRQNMKQLIIFAILS